MDMPTKEFVLAGSLEELRAKGRLVLHGNHRVAAHSPTERAALQTADIARRLMLGGELHQETGAS